MPALPNVPGVLKVNLGWTTEANTKAETIHHFSYTGGPPSGANAVTMANSFLASAATVFEPLIGDSVYVSTCSVTDLTSPTSAQGVNSTGGGTGTRGTALLAPGTSMVISHTINRRYRGGHPRSYFPFGVSADVATTGLWTSALAAASLTAFNTWVADVLAAGAGCTLSQLVNVSYYHGSTVVTSPTTGRARNVPTLRATPIVDTITGSVARVKIGSQRRRNKDA